MVIFFRSSVSGELPPAPGFRDAGFYEHSGALYHVGNDGYCWSSTLSETYGMILGFSVTWLAPCGVYHRAVGFQLRYLSE